MENQTNNNKANKQETQQASEGQHSQILHNNCSSLRLVKPEDERVVRFVMSRKFYFPTAKHLKIAPPEDRVVTWG